MSITKKLIKQDKGLETHAAEAVAKGLQHINTDVQEACLKFLNSLPSPISSKARSIVANLRESVAPSLLSQVDPLLRMDTAAAETPAAISDSKQEAARLPPQLQSASSLVPQRIRTAYPNGSASITDLQKACGRASESDSAVEQNLDCP